MNAPADQTLKAASVLEWSAVNRQWLVAAIAVLRARLEGEAPSETPLAPPGFTSALDDCAVVFGLSPFERELLLLLAGLELDEALRATVTTLNAGQSSRAGFALAFAHLTGPHWDALSPQAPLRKWRMISLEAGYHLTTAPLHLDERILHHISGLAVHSSALQGLARIVVPGESPFHDDLPSADRLRATLSAGGVIVLQDNDHSEDRRRDLALSLVRQSGGIALWINSANLPDDPQSIAQLAVVSEREARLMGAIPVVAGVAASRERALTLAGLLDCGFIWLGPDGSDPGMAVHGREVMRLAVPRRTAADTCKALTAHWQLRAPASLRQEPATLAEFKRAATQFQIEGSDVDRIIERVLAAASGDHAEAVWSAAREAARQSLDGLAQRIETNVTFDDLVLPAGHKSMLTDMARQLRQRERVYREWGFGAKHRLGQGLVALFAGESGTGKTLAAEAIAHDAELDLYRIDLAALVSKYIGETEKNLKRLFDAAEASGAVLVFDEADALFGKRSEVKDSHDRYANIEVSYLLQRVEAYRGLAILTTNMKGALDRAFLRRIRHIVTFPFPDQPAREEIWRRQFPREAPVGEIDFEALARLNLPGGNIRNIALSAAFKAADAGGWIDQTLLMSAAREEFAKLGRPLGESVQESRSR